MKFYISRALSNVLQSAPEEYSIPYILELLGSVTNKTIDKESIKVKELSLNGDDSWIEYEYLK